MNRTLVYTLFFLFITSFANGQQPGFSTRIDSLLAAKTSKPFNGVILIAQEGQPLYKKVYGYADLEKTKALKSATEFVVGSISKQITAILVLQAYEKKLLSLHQPIGNYLPELKQSWADTVTIHHLLTHTHGITKLQQPLAFRAGSQFLYSQLGYQLLADILEKTTGKSFAALSDELFRQCAMKNTCHPALNKHKKLAEGITELPDGTLIKDPESLQNYVAAGSFISTAHDLVKWNNALHGGKLLADSTYTLMTTKKKNAIRDHVVFGQTEYGYGVTINTDRDILQLGLTGYAPGFVSMNFYFPVSKISIVVLSNVAWDYDNFKNTFLYHTQVLKFVRESGLIKQGF